MEYKKLTASEAENITLGACINFGNGSIWEVIKVFPPEVTNPKGEFTAEIKDQSTFRVIKSDLRQLTQGTIESLDPTIEKCEQCGSLRPASEMITAPIWKRNPVRQDPGRFCADKPCAEHWQMGTEG